MIATFDELMQSGEDWKGVMLELPSVKCSGCSRRMLRGENEKEDYFFLCLECLIILSEKVWVQKSHEY